MEPKQDLNTKEVRAILHDHNSRGRGRSPAEKRETYARYNQIKRRVLKIEKTNSRYLVLFPASDIETNEKNKFYNMGGASAIIYVHEIGPRIKRKPTLRRDMDSGNDGEKFHSGICSIADVNKLEEKLAEIGIKKVKVEDDDGLIIFKLHRDYPKEEIREMLKQEQKDLDNLNKLLYSKVLYPDIHRQVIELKKIVPAKVKNMDKTYREVIGMKMIDSLMLLVRYYSEMAHGDIDELEAGKRMMSELDMMLATISVFNELKLWDVSACARVGTIIISARQLIRGRILNKCDS